MGLTKLAFTTKAVTQDTQKSCRKVLPRRKLYCMFLYSNKTCIHPSNNCFCYPDLNFNGSRNVDFQFFSVNQSHFQDGFIIDPVEHHLVPDSSFCWISSGWILRGMVHPHFAHHSLHSWINGENQMTQQIKNRLWLPTIDIFHGTGQ